MLGYVVPDQGELKVREYELYGAFYCGICRSVRDRCGQVPRLLLSYDAVFLAMLLSAVLKETDPVETGRCMLRPAKKRSIAGPGPILDYAADMMLLLGYYNLKDDYEDEGSLLGLAGMRMLKKAHRRLQVSMPEKCRQMEQQLSAMRELEQNRCRSFDRAAEPFARLMEVLLSYDYDAKSREEIRHPESLQYALSHIGHSLGKWIYLMDACDDIEKDLKHDAYNPLIESCGYGHGEYRGETTEAFRSRIAERVRTNAMLYLSDMAEVLDLLPIRKYRGILENIIYLGLLKKTDDIISRKSEENEKRKPN